MLRREGALIYEGPTRAPLVALTVDDGPDPRFTPGILEVLERERVSATFFVVGQNVVRYPGLVRRAVADGCELANHTFTHPDLRALSPGELLGEVSRTQQAIYAITGQRPCCFRPPRGYLTRPHFRAMADAGFIVIMWSAAVENHQVLTVEGMARRVVSKVVPGTIILLHDGRLDRTRTVTALPLIIRGLKARGFDFVTVSQLLSASAPQSDYPAFELGRGGPQRL